MIKMTKLLYEAWANELARHWEEKNILAAVKMFSKCSVYLETPFTENAAASGDGIQRLWEEIDDQENIKISVKLIASETTTAVFSYKASFVIRGNSHESAGIWIVEFESENCVSFRQWFNVR